MAERRLERKFRTKIDAGYCVYCGDPTQCFDHFPPHSSTVHGFLLPACLECNNLAGVEYPFNFDARCNLVKRKIQSKYKKILETSTWSDEETRPLGYNLKIMVTSWEEQRRAVASRLAWNVHAYLASIEIAKDFVQLNAEIDTMPEKEQDAFMKQIESSKEPEISLYEKRGYRR